MDLQHSFPTFEPAEGVPTRARVGFLNWRLAILLGGFLFAVGVLGARMYYMTILRGPYEDFNGVISELLTSHKIIRVKAIVSGREITLEFNAKQIRIAQI